MTARSCMVLGLAFIVIASIQNASNLELVPDAGALAAVLIAIGFVFGFSRNYFCKTKSERMVERGQQWANLRSRGRRYYIVVHCVLFGAYPISILAGFINLFPLEIQLPFDDLLDGVVYLSIWTVMGIGFGFWSWFVNERKMGPVQDMSSRAEYEVA